MGYKEFSTPGADYVLSAIGHPWPRRPSSLFEGVDAIVTEGANRFQDTFSQRSMYEVVITAGGHYFASSRLVSEVRNNGKPLFSVDVGLSEDRSDWYGTSSLTWRFFRESMFYSFANRQIPDDTIDYCTRVSLECMQPILAGRSSLAAHKIETYLVPLISKKIGRKPKIGLIYGGSHLDLVRFLQDENLRKEITTHFAKTGYRGLVSGTVDDLTEYTFHPAPNGRDGCWTVKRCNISSLNRKKNRRKKGRKRR